MRLKLESPKIAFFATVDVAKGLVSFEDFASTTIINHFDRKFPFVDKQRLTKLIKKRHGSTAPYFTDTVLAENLDRETVNNVKSTVLMNLIKSFASYTSENYSINYRSHDQIKFALSQLENFNPESKKWKKLEKFLANAKISCKQIKISTGKINNMNFFNTSRRPGDNSKTCDHEYDFWRRKHLDCQGKSLTAVNLNQLQFIHEHFILAHKLVELKQSRACRHVVAE
jgi:hypothetical protein